jgi:hypothetical protein
LRHKQSVGKNALVWIMKSCQHFRIISRSLRTFQRSCRFAWCPRGAPFPQFLFQFSRTASSRRTERVSDGARAFRLAKSLGIGGGDWVRLHARVSNRVPPETFACFVDGIGINTLVIAELGYPNGGARAMKQRRPPSRRKPLQDAGDSR